MRSLILAAVAALAFATAAQAGGPYHLDATGKCHGADGKLALSLMCKSAPKPMFTPGPKPAANTGPAAVSHAGPVSLVCKTGVRCGNSCIPKGKVCHKH